MISRGWTSSVVASCQCATLSRPRRRGIAGLARLTVSPRPRSAGLRPGTPIAIALVTMKHIDTTIAPDITPRALLSELMIAQDWQRSTRPVVVLPDGTVGECVWSGRDTVKVIHADRRLGRGPWHMHPSQCERATMGQTIEYMRRCGGVR